MKQLARPVRRHLTAVAAIVSAIVAVELQAQVAPRQFTATSHPDSSAIVAALIEGEYLPSGSEFMVQLTDIRLSIDESASYTQIRSVSAGAAPCWGGLLHVIPPVAPSQIVDWSLEAGVTVIQDTLVFQVPMSQTDPTGCRLRIRLLEGSGRVVARLESGDLQTLRTWQPQADAMKEKSRR